MTKSNPKAPSYQKLKDELDSCLTELQREDLDIDQALEHYQRGLELVKELETYLEGTQNKVKELKATFNSSLTR